MLKGKATKADYSNNNNDDEFCRLTLTVEVEANQVLVFGIRAKWFLIDWEMTGWSESKRHKFKKAGFHNINIIGGRIIKKLYKLSRKRFCAVSTGRWLVQTGNNCLCIMVWGVMFR